MLLLPSQRASLDVKSHPGMAAELGLGVSVTSLWGCRGPDPVDHWEREGTTQRTVVLKHYISCIAS